MQLNTQKKNWNKGNNQYLAGITAHNLAVVKILSNHSHYNNNNNRGGGFGGFGGKEEKEDEKEMVVVVVDTIQDILHLLQEAIQLKEMAFGKYNSEVAYSWDELGIQLYANNQFEDALEAFSQAQHVRLGQRLHPQQEQEQQDRQQNPTFYNNNNNNKLVVVDPISTITGVRDTTVVASSPCWEASLSIPSQQSTNTTMGTTRTAAATTTTLKRQVATASGFVGVGIAMVLNNIACCNFQLKNFKSALVSLQEARSIQEQERSSNSSSSSTMGKHNNNKNNNNNNLLLTRAIDLDLLYRATVMCNCGYLHLCLKMYDDARSLLEEALLIQQSVLDDSHRAIRDTRSNLELTNAFHL